MSIIVTLLLILAVAYIILYFILFIGTLISLSPPKEKIPEAELPHVTVLVSAKNEEHVIRTCMDSLAALDYPHDKLEIIMIDNDSTDNTSLYMEDYAVNHAFMKTFRTGGDDGSGLKGKIQAINQGISVSNGEYIFTTDADCCVKPEWIKETLNYYDNRTGVVNGFTIMDSKSFFGTLQSIDWLFMLSLCSSSAGIGKPISCVGNNMSYRRTAYDEVGGYSGIPFSVTEDFMLQKMIDSKTKWKTKFPVNKNCLNLSTPCLTILELWRQKHRWGVGGLKMRPWGVLIGVITWIAGIMFIFGWTVLTLKAYLTFVIIKLLIDLFYLLPAVIQFREFKLLLYIIPLQLYMSLYSTILFISLLFDRKVIWKKEHYNKSSS